MKKLLLATVATIALSTSGVLAAEPSAHGGGMSAGSEMKGHAPGKAETTGSGAAENKSQAAPGGAASPNRSETTGAASDDGKPNAEPRAKSQSDTKSHSDSGRASSTNRRETTGAGASEERSGTHSRDSSSSTMKNDSGSTKSSSDDKADSGRNAPGSRASSQSSTTTGSGGSTVSLTTEQKTKIRTTVIDKGPKIEKSQINFSLNVGTVVPRSVLIVSVPTVLIDIHPEWRGYRYFVVGDELVIVEPDSLKIVAVLVV
jgi:hypothetical protein